MSAQHTPGPFAVAQNSHRNMAVVLGPDMEHLAYVAGETTAQQLRDAKLFAAAPDLLTALTKLLHDVDSEPDGEYLEGANKGCVAVHRIGIERARAAIAKATTP